MLVLAYFEFFLIIFGLQTRAAFYKRTSDKVIIIFNLMELSLMNNI